MPTSWTIDKAGTNANGSELVGCHIKINGNCYQFLTPSNTLCSSACGTSSLPTLPCNFPVFSSALAGSTVVNWYITLESVTDGPSNNKAKGKWGNSNYQFGITDVDSDGWTTSAGVGIDPEGDDVENEKGREAAASASPKS
jgi:hypothetical protein